MLRSVLTFYIFLILADFRAQTNVDFEQTSPGAYTASNAVNGWTVSSQTLVITPTCSGSPWAPGSQQFSIVSTPFFTTDFPASIIGTLPHSPLGGAHVARLNGTTPGSTATRIAYTYTVNPSNALAQFAFAGAWESCGPQSFCCEQAGFKIAFKDSYGIELGCITYSMSATSSCYLPSTNYFVTPNGGIYWNNWQKREIDLSSVTGSMVTVEISSRNCAFNSHRGSLFLDMALSSPPPSINFCAGASQAVLQGPLGYATYSWTAPGPPLPPGQGTSSSFTVTNPVAGAVYTLYALTEYSCIIYHTYTLTPAQVSISSVKTSPNCFGAANGSSTVTVGGSGGGYLYNWINSSSLSVGTGSAVNNLVPGIYTVSAMAAGSASTNCGTATAVIVVNPLPQNLTSFVKSVCNITTTLCASGNTIQWYNGSNSISPSSGGTATCYPVLNPIGGSIFSAGYVNAAGCRDSVAYTLNMATPGSVNFSIPNLICPGASNGSVVVTLAPAQASPGGINSISVAATGTTPAYISGMGPVPSVNHIANGMKEGTYTISAADGLCTYSKSFTVAAHYFDYAISKTQDTICEGTMLQASVVFTSPVSPSYSYSWTPNTFLFNPTVNPVVIVASISPNTVITTAYSVTVTHMLSNCAITKTIAVTIMNPPTPTIIPIPLLCHDALSTHTISVNPPGGVFSSSNSAVNLSTGVINGLLGNVGQNSFTYTWPKGSTCAKSITATFTVNKVPIISISGNTTICAGQTTTLFAGGAVSYSWNSSAGSSSLVLNPGASNIYTLTGKDIQTNCSGSTTAAVNVQAFPSLQIAGISTLCIGETSALSASGANTYSWSDGSNGASIVISPTTGTTYTLSGSTSPILCVATKTIAVKINSCSGIHETQEDLFRVYPNPATDRIFIETQKELTFSLIDGLGRILLQKHILQGNYEINLDGFSNGVYFIQVSRPDEVKILKLVKNQE